MDHSRCSKAGTLTVQAVLRRSRYPRLKSKKFRSQSDQWKLFSQVCISNNKLEGFRIINSVKKIVAHTVQKMVKCSWGGTMTLQESFENIKDERIERCKKHNLVDILMLVFVGVLCGYKSIGGITSAAAIRLPR